MKEPIYTTLARLVNAYQTCKRTGNEHADMHEERILSIVKEHLPSGSGFDNGTKIDLDASKDDKLVLQANFHHMNEHGYYDGWTEHQVIVTPSLAFGLAIKVTGRNKRDIKDYISDTYYKVLRDEIDPYADKA